MNIKLSTTAPGPILASSVLNVERPCAPMLFELLENTKQREATEEEYPLCKCFQVQTNTLCVSVCRSALMKLLADAEAYWVGALTLTGWPTLITVVPLTLHKYMPYICITHSELASAARKSGATDATVHRIMLCDCPHEDTHGFIWGFGIIP